MPNTWPTAEMFHVVKEILKWVIFYFFLGTMPNDTQHGSYEHRAEKKGVITKELETFGQS